MFANTDKTEQNRIEQSCKLKNKFMGILWNTKKALKTCEFFFILGLLFQGWGHTVDSSRWQRLETLLVRKVNCMWFLHPHYPNFRKKILKHYQRHSNNSPTLLRDCWSWWLLKVAEYSCSVKSQLLVASCNSLLLACKLGLKCDIFSTVHWSDYFGWKLNLIFHVNGCWTRH